MWVFIRVWHILISRLNPTLLQVFNSIRPGFCDDVMGVVWLDCDRPLFWVNRKALFAMYVWCYFCFAKWFLICSGCRFGSVVCCQEDVSDICCMFIGLTV